MVCPTGQDDEREWDEEAYISTSQFSKFRCDESKINVPSQVRNVPKASIAKVGSVNGRKKSMALTGLGRGGMRLTTVKQAMLPRPRIKNAQIRMVQPKPTCGMSFSTMIGKMTPPSDDPDAVTPRARARFLKNHVVTADMAG